MESIRASTAKGVKWTAASTLFLAITAFLFQVIKARFLTPEEFAYLAILFIFIGFMRHLEGAGFTKGVIQKDEVEVEEASSLFVFIMAMSVSMAALLYAVAVPVAGFFELQGLDHYLRILSYVFLLHGPARFYRAFLQKFFLFREIALVEIIRQALFVALTTFLLAQGWGVLGFVYGKMAATAAATLLFVFFGVKHRVTGLRPYFSFEKLRFFLRFGAFASGRGLLNYAAKRVDEVAIGYFLDPEVLGIYFFGKNMLERLRGLVDRSYSKLLFPLFSKLKNEQQRLSDTYFKLTHYVAMFAFPVFLGLALTAHLFVPLVYGPQWSESILVIQVFAVAFILKMLTDGLAGNVLYAVNRPDTAFYLDVVTDGLYFLGLVFFASLGMQAVLVLYSSYIVTRALAMQYAAHRHLSNGMVDFFFLMRGAAAISLVMVAAMIGFQLVFSPLGGELFLLLGSVAVGTVVYTALTWIFDRQGLIELRGLMKSGEKGV